jgi:DNA-binding NarL/FixJ family response regulator
MRQTRRNSTISLALIDEYSFTRESIAMSLQELCNLLEIVSYATLDECLESAKNYDIILYHAHDSVANINHNDEKCAYLRELQSSGPTIILCDCDSVESIQAAFDTGVRGYIPTVSTTLEIAIEIMFLINVGGTFVPQTSSLPRKNATQGRRNPITSQSFTPRQSAVLDCLKVGKTNKIIAYELKMSESSVKMHIRNIMRKMNATNRTEVACRAHEFEGLTAQTVVLDLVSG